LGYHIALQILMIGTQKREKVEIGLEVEVEVKTRTD
jgi:hypothetical protein